MTADDASWPAWPRWALAILLLAALVAGLVLENPVRAGRSRDHSAGTEGGDADSE